MGSDASLRDSKLNSKMKQPAQPVQQRLDVGNRDSAADTANGIICYQLNHAFLNRNISFKNYRDFLETKNDILSINAKHEECR